MNNGTESTQLAVIGAGPGGYAAAFLAADLGMKVTLIDPRNYPGGVCLFEGCIPTKALLHACRVKKEAAEAGRFGIAFSEPVVDKQQLNTWKNTVVDKLVKGLGQLVTLRGIRYIRGTAQFRDAHSLQVRMHDGSTVALSFDHAIVATGSEPVALPGLPFNSPNVLDSTKALDVSAVPASLLVIGGGYIGLELGTVYSCLGCAVTLVEMLPEIMARADKDLRDVLLKEIGRYFTAIHTGTRASVRDTPEGVAAVLENKEGKKELRFDKVLVTVGRRPNTGNLGLEHTRVEKEKNGDIKVDGRRRTAEPSIYAIGDITGPPQLAHKATHEGRIAVEAIAGRDVSFDPYAIPSVEYSDPEMAWCGLTEAAARESGKTVKTSVFHWAASGAALTKGITKGLTKLVVDPETDRILGVGIVGNGASELISEGALAIEMAARVSDLGLTIHPHPTLSETLMEAAEAYGGTSTHMYRPRKP